MLKEFRDFVARGNVLDLAVGVIMGAAFGRIVTTLVEGVIMPPIGLLLGRTDFSGLFLVLDSTKGIPMSLAEAKTQGVPVIAYGQFINDIVSFLDLGLSVSAAQVPIVGPIVGGWVIQRLRALKKPVRTSDDLDDSSGA